MNAAAIQLAFEAAFGETPAVVARAPGRVNLLGEHVDYNQGLALPCAIDRSSWIAVGASYEPVCRLYSVDFDAWASFDPAPSAASVGDESSWARYPAGVAWAFRAAGQPLDPFRAVLSSEVPIGAGLSSSAAIEVGFALALQHLFGTSFEPLALARLCQQAENDFVGVHCGLMDQWTSVSAEARHALLLDFEDLSSELVPLPDDLAIVVADTGVRRALAASAYNERVGECREAVRRLHQEEPEITSLRSVPPDSFERISRVLPEPIRSRARHVVEEINRVRAGARLLAEGETDAFGRLMTEAHLSLRDLYAVSGPELEAMVDAALDLPGCLGTRLTGAGFGGSTVSLVRRSSAEDFVSQLKDGYQARTGRTADVWICRAEQGAQILEAA